MCEATQRTSLPLFRLAHSVGTYGFEADVDPLPFALPPPRVSHVHAKWIVTNRILVVRAVCQKKQQEVLSRSNEYLAVEKKVEQSEGRHHPTAEPVKATV